MHPPFDPARLSAGFAYTTLNPTSTRDTGSTRLIPSTAASIPVYYPCPSSLGMTVSSRPQALTTSTLTFNPHAPTPTTSMIPQASRALHTTTLALTIGITTGLALFVLLVALQYLFLARRRRQEPKQPSSTVLTGDKSNSRSSTFPVMTAASHPTTMQQHQPAHLPPLTGLGISYDSSASERGMQERPTLERTGTWTPRYNPWDYEFRIPSPYGTDWGGGQGGQVVHELP